MKEIVCIFNQIESSIDLEIACFHVGFAKKTRLVKKFNMNITKTLDEISFDELDNLSLQIQNKLLDLNFKNASLNLGLNIEQTFIEDFLFPVLSNASLEKALMLEMNKLYTNFEEKYICSIVTFLPNPKSIKIKVLLCEKKIYSKIMYFIKQLNLKVKKIYYLPSGMRNLIVKLNLMNNNKVNLFINVHKKYTSILFIHKTFLELEKTYKINLDNMDLELEEKDVLHIDNKQFNLENKIKNIFQHVFQDIKRIVANTLNNQEAFDLENIYIHIEDIKYQVIANVFLKEFNHCIVKTSENDSVMHNFLVYSGLTKLDSNLDFLFSIKEKI